MKCPAEGVSTLPASLQGITGYRLSSPRQNHRGDAPWTHLPRQKKINFSTVFAGQAVGIKEVHDDIWLVSFMDYDLVYIGLEEKTLHPLANPFGPKVLPM